MLEKLGMKKSSHGGHGAGGSGVQEEDNASCQPSFCSGLADSMTLRFSEGCVLGEAGDHVPLNIPAVSEIP